MKCLRCGHCCQYLWVVIVKDPELGLREDNLTVFEGGVGKRCPHLRGNKPGEFSCAVHKYPWYQKTPCFSHGQIERSKSDPCRMGQYLLKNNVRG